MNNWTSVNALVSNLGSLNLSGGQTSGKSSWLHAIAEAMGKKVGELATSMTQHANDVGSSNAKKAAGASAKLTADSQLFSMYMNALSTVLKSIGEGNAAVARKQ